MERLINGSEDRSRSTSSITRTPKAPRKSDTTPRKKRRSRRVIETSPPPVESSRTNGEVGEDLQRPPEEFLEIDESPASSPPKAAGAGSPLFEPEQESKEPQDLPDGSQEALEEDLDQPQEDINQGDRRSPHQPDAAVHLPPPPSSYLAGGYQSFSTQANAGASEARSSPGPEPEPEPEPSQYVSDVDTSNGTADTSNITAAPTTPSQQVQSVPVNFGSSAVQIVPDSQSLRWSDSYAPTATVTTSSSAPESRQLLAHSEEQSAVGVERTDAPTTPVQESHHSSGSSNQSPIVATPSGEDQAEVEGAIAADLGEGAAELRENTPQSEEQSNLVEDIDTSPGPASNPVASDKVQTHEPSESVNIDLPQHSNPDTLHTADAAELEERTLPKIAEEAQSRAREGDVTQLTESPSKAAAAHTSLAVITSPRIPENLRQLNTAVPPLSQPAAQSLGGSPEKEQPDIENVERPSSASQIPTNSISTHLEPTSAAATAHVDLTYTQNQPALKAISVTPPQQRTFTSNHRHPLQPLDSSAWQSSFPFQTQIPVPSAIEAATPNFNSPASDRVSPQVSQDQTPLRDTARPSPTVSSQPTVQRYARFSPTTPKQASSQPAVAGAFAFDGSAPSPPRLPSSPIRPSQESTMEHSQPPASLVARLEANRRAAKERREAQRSANQRSATPSSAPPSEASKTTSPTTVKPAAAPELHPTAPPKLASPFLMPEDRARSPSAVPHFEPLPVITRDEMNTSRRVETLLPQSQNQPEEAQQNGTLTTAGGTPDQVRPVEQDPETASMHVVPIYLIGHQRDHYPEVIYNHREFIDQYLSFDAPDGLMVQEAKLFADRMRRVVMHPDLDNNETALTQYDVSPSQQAKWDVDCSAKFRFLKELLDHIRHSNLRIAIVASPSPSRIVDMLETFLRGIKISYSRIGAKAPAAQEDVDGNVHVTLFDTKATNSDKADVVIAMDNSVKHSGEYVRSARLHDDGRWAPFFTLVVPRSVEHIERCLSPTLSDRAKTRALVSGIKQFWDKAGKSQDGQTPRDTARLVGQYLTNFQSDVVWPLPPLANLEDLDSQTDSEIDIIITNAATVGEKRSRDDEDADFAESNKRSRMVSPATGTAPEVSTAQDLDVTHISDSIAKPTQDAGTLTTNEKRLQDLLIAAQDRLEAHVKDLSDLQYRQEEQRRRIVEVTSERDEAIETAARAVARLSEESNKISNLRSESSSLREQLKDANTRLLEHSIPERAELESLRLQVQEAIAKQQKAEKRVEQANKETAYIREIFQQNSNNVSELTAQVSELQNELASTRNKATGEQARLRQMGYEAFTKNLQEENRKLKQMLKERDTGLKFRDDEIAKLKEASRGRMGTRGTSVPRSPRMGSPRIGGGGSRQTSPAAGELRGRTTLHLHPLRNAES